MEFNSEFDEISAIGSFYNTILFLEFFFNLKFENKKLIKERQQLENVRMDH